jgi:O-antigen ligase
VHAEARLLVGSPGVLVERQLRSHKRQGSRSQSRRERPDHPAFAVVDTVHRLSAGASSQWILVGALLLLAPLIGVGTLAAGVLVVGLAAAVTYVVIAYKSLAAGLALFVFLTFYDRAAATIGGVTFTKLAGAVLVLIWLLALLAPGKRTPFLPRDNPLLAAVALSFVGWVLVTTLWARDFEIALASAFRLLQAVVLLFVIYTALGTRRHVFWVVAAFIAGAVLSAFLGVQSSGAGERISGGFDDPEELAAAIVPGAVLVGFAFLAARGHRARWLLLPLLPFLGVALLRSDTQGAFVAVGVALIAIIAFGGPIRRRAAIAVSIVALAGVGYYTFVTSPAGLTEGSASRRDLWAVNLLIAADHPIAGVGGGNGRIVQPTYATSTLTLPRIDLIVEPEEAHNTYIHILVEYGIVGLLLFVGLLTACVGSALRAASRFASFGSPGMALLSRGVVVAIAAVATSSVFFSAQYEKQLWLLLGLAAVLDRVAASEARASRVAPPRLGNPAPPHF